MTITNKFNIPEPFLLLEKATHYSRGDAKYSATTLMKAPRAEWLNARHREKRDEDISDMLTPLLGTAIHTTLQIAAEREPKKFIAEERFFAVVNDVLISGGIDLQTVMDKEKPWYRKLSDYKSSSVGAIRFKLSNPDKAYEWEQQLNEYAFLARENGYDPTGLEIVAIMWDWKKTDLMRDTKGDYPQCPIQVIPITMWKPEEAERYVKRRLEMHEAAEDLADNNLPPCTDEEMWYKPKQFAVYSKLKSAPKKWGKRALRVFGDDMEADLFAEEQERETRIDVRPEVYTKCDDWCSVNKHCNIFLAREGNESTNGSKNNDKEEDDFGDLSFE